MDAGSVNKPVFVQVTTTDVRASAPAQTDPTTLPADKAVLPAREADRARLQREREPQGERAAVDIASLADRAPLERRVTIDDESGRVLLQAVHGASGNVVRQLPAEMMLRLGTYAQEQAASGETKPLTESTGTDRASRLEKTA